MSNLDRAFISGIKWTAASKAATQLFSWLAFFLAARIMGPEEYGVIAGASIFTGIIALVAEFGLGSAIISNANVNDEDVSQLGGLSLFVALVVMFACWGLAKAVADVLKAPRIAEFFPVLGVTLGISTYLSIPLSVLRKRLDFKRAAKLEAYRAVIASTTLAVLAFRGFEAWSLVVSEFLATAFLAVALTRSAGLTPSIPDISRLRHIIVFSFDVLLSRIGWYVYSNADFAVISRRFGEQTLGQYSLAWTIASMPTEKIASLVFGVTPSIFAHAREDKDGIKRYVLRLMEMLSMLVFPVSLGMIFVAHDAIQLLLGPSWLGAAPLLQALAGLGVIRALSPIPSQVFVSLGNARLSMIYSLATAVIMPTAFLVASRWGATAVALCWVAVFPSLAIAQILVMKRLLSISAGEIWISLRTSIISTAAMVCVLLPTAGLLKQLEISAAFSLAGTVFTGAIVYSATLFVIAKDRLNAVLTALR